MHVAGGTSIISIAADPGASVAFFRIDSPALDLVSYLFSFSWWGDRELREVAFVELRHSKLIRSKHLEMVSGAIVSQVEVRLVPH